MHNNHNLNKMKSIYKYLFIASTPVILSACSDKDKWEPGEPAPANMGVFFTDLNKYDVTIEADDPRVFTVGMGRIDATESASVPIKVVSCPEGVVIPSTVEFEAGKETTSFEIDVNDMPLKTSGNIILQIDPAYAALYGAGSSQMTMKVTTTGGWEVVADDVVISCYLNSYPDLSATMYVLEGTDRFKIPDFMGSGTDLVFTVSNTSLSSPVIFPYTNCKYYYDLWSSYEDDEDYPWYFYNTEKAAYPAIWTPDGWSKSIEYLTFYVYDDGDKGCYFGINRGYGMMTAYIDFADGSGTWEYFEFNFTPKFNPFEQE